MDLPFNLKFSPDFTLETSFILLVTILGSVFDCGKRKIPNWLTFGSFFVLLLFNVFTFKFGNVLNCVLGFFLGIALFFIPYLTGGMGAGDVKLLGAVGAAVGYKGVIYVFFLSGICGLVLGLVWILCRPEHLKFLLTTGKVLPTIDKKQKVPYGVAIMAGTLLYIIF